MTKENTKALTANEKEENKKEYREFRELLLKGIGSRSQLAFAEETGISKGHLNRLINNELISRPKKSTLINFAKHMTTVTYAELLEACDYEVLPIAERVKEFEKSLQEGVSELSGLYDSLDSFFDTLDTLYMPEADVEFQMAEKITENKNRRFANAEVKKEGKAVWKDPDYFCVTNFEIYYTETKSNKILPIGIELLETPMKDEDGKEIMSATTYSKRSKDPSLEERILRVIFGTSEDDLRPIMIKGAGISYDYTPEGFRDFLIKHSGTFCKTKENVRVYQKIINANDSELDQICEEYYEEEWEAHGSGAIVANIMRAETGRLYAYYDPDERIDPKIRNAFIMEEFGQGDNDRISQDRLIELYSYAKELKVPTFGMCHYMMTAGIDKRQIYETDTYYLNFK